MKPIPTLMALALAAAALQPLPAQAGPGHDHGHDHGAAAPAAGPAMPRFAAATELFELVGVLDGQRITLYLDRSADNAPVSGAQIELTIGDARFKAEPRDDVFEVVLPARPQPGVLPVTATVTAGADIDLLAAELDIHDDAAHGEAAAHAHGWREAAAWGAGALGIALVAGLAGRRAAAMRRARSGASA